MEFQVPDYFNCLACKLWVPSPYHGPEEELEGGLVVIEAVGSFVRIDGVNVDHAQSEGYVDDDEDE